MNDKTKIYIASPEGVVKHLAKDYIDKRFNSPRMRRLNKAEKYFATNALNNIPTNNSLIIDIPCGSGRLSEILSQSGQRNYLGIDSSQKMLDAALSDHPSLQYQLGNVLDIPVANNVASLVLCMRLLHHVELSVERISILQELARASSKWVAVSFYRQECFRVFSKKLRGKPVPGHPIAYKTFMAEAATVGLVKRKVMFNWLTGGAQTLVLLEKIST